MKSSTRVWLAVLVLSGIGLFLALGFSQCGFTPTQQKQLDAIEIQAQPIISGLEKYQQLHHMYPYSLMDLYPRFIRNDPELMALKTVYDADVKY